MLLYSILLTFLHAHFTAAYPINPCGFKCTNLSKGKVCIVNENVLRFFVIGDIGGEEYETCAEGHLQQKCTLGKDCTVKSENKCSTVVKHRPTKGQTAVAKAMDLLAIEKGLTPHFLLNLGDNFYESGVTFADVKTRLEENFTKVYHHSSLNVPWYTIAGNNDWESKDQIQPQIDLPKGKWTFPAPYYVSHYEFGNKAKRRISARFIMIDTTVLCGTSEYDFDKTKEKNADEYAKKISEAKTHFKWLHKQLRKAKQQRVHFLFVAGHYPLHIVDDLPKAHVYPCAPRVMALMRFFQVQVYFAGHAHNLKYFDLSTHETSAIRTKYIVSGAGSRMENAINESRFPDKYMEYMKFRYPLNVGNRPKVPGEVSVARGVLDGGGFVGVEIDADKMIGKLNFYAAGMYYRHDGTKESIAKWHKFEEAEIHFLPRQISERDKKGNICKEFLALVNDMGEEDHYKMDLPERIQSKLGTYFCVNLKMSKKKLQFLKNIKDRKLSKVIENGMENYPKEAIDAKRRKFGIHFKNLANSFLSDDLIEMNFLGKPPFYCTKDNKFLLKCIQNDIEGQTNEEILKNTRDDLIQMKKWVIGQKLLAFRLKIEDDTSLFVLMENVVDKDENSKRLFGQ